MYRLNPATQPRLIFLILVLFAMIGPLSIDLFTPSLPAITEAFGTTADTSQWTVSIFMLGFALSMLIVGPVSERFGYRRTLMGGYAIYLLATLTILLTSTIEIFIAARLVQAIFGCFGTALSRVLARDLYKGENSDVRILGMIGATMMVAPMVAPTIGGVLQQTMGWQASFGLMLLIGVVGIIAVTLLPGQDKTNPDARLLETFTSFGILFKDRQYMAPALTAAMAFAGAFVFVVGAPFILIGHFEITPRDYGMIFGMVMGAYILASSAAGKITDLLGRRKATLLAWAGLVIGALIAFVSAILTDGQSLTGLVIGIIIYEAGLGLFLPSYQAKALSHLDQHAGTGAGLIFFLEMIVASAVSYLVGNAPLNNTSPLAAFTMAMLVLALGVSILVKGRNVPASPSVEP